MAVEITSPVQLYFDTALTRHARQGKRQMLDRVDWEGKQ